MPRSPAKRAPGRSSAPDGPERSLAVVPVHPKSERLGYLGAIVVAGDRVWAVGGTYFAPTILHSADRGRSFTTWKTPENVPGLRDVHVDGDTVWVVGERGAIAHTSDGGATWDRIESPGFNCLYSIEPDSKGRLWILGDHGLILRGKPHAKRFTEIENKSKARLLYMLVEGDDDIWVLDSSGMLQRNRGPNRAFVEVPLAAMRNPRPLCALVRTPANTLLLLCARARASDGGLVLRSTDDGASWERIPIDSRNHLERICVTRYGIFIVGAHGSILVSHDDGRSFQGLANATGDDRLQSIAEIGGDLLVGGDRGQIWRVEQHELAVLMSAAYRDRDPVLSDLAARLAEGLEGAELVLEDALRERELL